tara:strand:+ start:813 stop:1196 length:384 start_codon:yes stop_codon:yes gene_type:complete
VILLGLVSGVGAMTFSEACDSGVERACSYLEVCGFSDCGPDGCIPKEKEAVQIEPVTKLPKKIFDYSAPIRCTQFNDWVTTDVSHTLCDKYPTSCVRKSDPNYHFDQYCTKEGLIQPIHLQKGGINE